LGKRCEEAHESWSEEGRGSLGDLLEALPQGRCVAGFRAQAKLLKEASLRIARARPTLG
jgi:hypothetical protein